MLILLTFWTGKQVRINCPLSLSITELPLCVAFQGVLIQFSWTALNTNISSINENNFLIFQLILVETFSLDATGNHTSISLILVERFSLDTGNHTCISLTAVEMFSLDTAGNHTSISLILVGMSSCRLVVPSPLLGQCLVSPPWVLSVLPWRPAVQSISKQHNTGSG